MPEGAWNSKAIEAVFDGIMLDEDKHALFYYVLKNATDSDYRLSRGPNVAIMMKLRGQKQLLRELSDQQLRLSYPISIRGRQRQIVTLQDLRRTYNFKERLPEHPGVEAYQPYQKKLEAFIQSQSPDFDGFVLFDKAHHYRIDLARGW